MLRIFLITTVLAGLSPGAAQADQRWPHLEWGLFTGTLLPSEKHDLYKPSATTQRPFIRPIAQLGGRISLLPWPYAGMELEAVAMPRASVFGGRDPATLLGARAQIIAQYPALISPFIAAGVGVLGVLSAEATSLGRDMDLDVHYGGGIKLRLRSWLHLRFDLRHMMTNAVFDRGLAHHVELLVGLSMGMNLKKADQDGDTVADVEDRCPAAAGPVLLRGCPDEDHDHVADRDDRCPRRPGLRAAQGCPDTDHDGLVDRDDRCPQGAGPRWLKGCPDQDSDDVPDREDSCPALRGLLRYRGCPDTDKDGLPDPEDRCPNKSGPKSTAGCPDSDLDGVPDSRDACPTARGKKPSGCPDDDGDGIMNAQDGCPTRPETKNHFRDVDGCPDRLPKALRALVGKPLTRLNFARGASRMGRGAHRQGGVIARVLRAYPDVRLRIIGRAPATMDPQARKTLALARANALRAYLVGRGVAFSRLDVTSAHDGLSRQKVPLGIRRWKRSSIRLELAPPSKP